MCSCYLSDLEGREIEVNERIQKMSYDAKGCAGMSIVKGCEGMCRDLRMQRDLWMRRDVQG